MDTPHAWVHLLKITRLESAQTLEPHVPRAQACPLITMHNSKLLVCLSLAAPKSLGLFSGWIVNKLKENLISIVDLQISAISEGLIFATYSKGWLSSRSFCNILEVPLYQFFKLGSGCSRHELELDLFLNRIKCKMKQTLSENSMG